MKTIILKVDGKTVLRRKCKNVAIQTMGGGVKCCSYRGSKSIKSECKNCHWENEFAAQLCSMAYDWAWFGSGNYEWETK